MEGNKPLWKDWPQKKPCLVQRYCVFLTDVYYHQFPGTLVPCTCSFHTVWGLGMRLPTSWGQFGGMISQPPLEHGLNLKCWYVATEASNTMYYTFIPYTDIHTCLQATLDCIIGIQWTSENGVPLLRKPPQCGQESAVPNYSLYYSICT